MVDDTLVRNSQSVTVFDEIIHSPEGTWRAVEIAGRGIAAAARCTLCTLDDKTRPNADPPDEAIQHALAFADRLMELGATEDELAALWRRRRADRLDDASFEEALRVLVQRLEAWPRQAGAAGAAHG